MLKDRKRKVERIAFEHRRNRRLVQDYAEFLRTHFGVGDWFVTITFRDRYQDSPREVNPPVLAFEASPFVEPGSQRAAYAKFAADPQLTNWEPDSRYRKKPGPPVRDAALREIGHWLVELGWEASGHRRQEIFDRLACGLEGMERRRFAQSVCRKCLCCAVLKDPTTISFYSELEKAGTKAIGWVIAEEFGKAGGRWHIHLLIRGVSTIWRKKWWTRAFFRFGRNRIEPIHG
jgi:hypothetical protein